MSSRSGFSCRCGVDCWAHVYWDCWFSYQIFYNEGESYRLERVSGYE